MSIHKRIFQTKATRLSNYAFLHRTFCRRAIYYCRRGYIDASVVWCFVVWCFVVRCFFVWCFIVVVDFVVGDFLDITIPLQYFLIINVADIKMIVPRIRSVVDRSQHESGDTNSSILVQPKAALDDIFTYKDPPMAGTGSYDEELRRYNIFMSTQGVICQNIRHFGGIYMKNKDPPEFDPDGSWYLCLDPEVSLRAGSCIVYSVGYVLSVVIKLNTTLVDDDETT